MSSSSSSSSSSDNNFSTLDKELLEKEVKCECQDGQLVPARVSLLLQCKAFSETMKTLDLITAGHQLPDGFVFPVRSVSANIFKKIVEWMEYRVGKPEPFFETDPITLRPKWFIFNEFENNYFKNGIDELAELVMAARFLDLNSLYLFCTQALAALLDSKTTEQIRELLGIEDDMTDAQKEEIRRKNAWCHFAA